MITIQTEFAMDLNSIRSDPMKTFIDLRPFSTNEEIIFSIGQILRTEQSASVQHDTPLDGLIDVMFDYFYENWGELKDVTILGLSSIACRDPLFAIKLINVVYSSFLTSAEAKTRIDKSANISNEMKKNFITFIWN